MCQNVCWRDPWLIKDSSLFSKLSLETQFSSYPYFINEGFCLVSGIRFELQSNIHPLGQSTVSKDSNVNA